MNNPLHLIPGQKYKVVKNFIDFDHSIHTIGETWVFIKTNFIPYNDGLTLHILKEEIETIYRFQWTKENQQDLLEHFLDYVEPC